MEFNTYSDLHNWFKNNISEENLYKLIYNIVYNDAKGYVNNPGDKAFCILNGIAQTRDVTYDNDFHSKNFNELSLFLYIALDYYNDIDETHINEIYTAIYDSYVATLCKLSMITLNRDVTFKEYKCVRNVENLRISLNEPYGDVWNNVNDESSLALLHNLQKYMFEQMGNFNQRAYKNYAVPFNDIYL